MNEAIFLQTITVTDPDSGGLVELCVYKHDNGGMFAIDASFVEQVLGPIDEDDDDINVLCVDPLSDPSNPTLIWLVEDGWESPKFCTIRGDLVEQGLMVEIQDGIRISGNASYRYRWTGDDKDQFQIIYNEEWMDAESIDFDF